MTAQDSPAPPPAPASAPAEAAAPPPAGPITLQDWSPISGSLDWHLGNLAFEVRGPQAFTTHEVPNLVNQGGLAAYRAADVLFARCAEADAAGALPAEIVGVEYGMGLGLFSLQLLDRFVARCHDAGVDYHDRLVWYATDAMPSVLRAAAANEVFARHADRVVLGLANALEPQTVQPVRWSADDPEREAVDLAGEAFAVVSTYALSVLPWNLLQRRERPADDAEDNPWGVVLARTMLAHPEALADYTSLGVEQVVAIAASGDRDALRQLVPLTPLLDVALTLAPLDLSTHPDRETLVALADALAAGGEAGVTWVLHSFGAERHLRAASELLSPGGMLLYRDYGPATAARANAVHVHQHYGPTTGSGVNHHALDRMLGQMAADGGWAFAAPEGEGEAMIKTRVLVRAGADEAPDTLQAFASAFAPTSFKALQDAVALARGRLSSGSAEDAMAAYREALKLEPANWVLLAEAGEVALYRLRHLETARMLLAEALRINPWYAADAWCLLGDVRWFAGDPQAARGCYERAIRANPEHYRGWHGMAVWHRERGELEAAVEMEARALARDVGGRAAASLEQSLTGLVRRLEARRAQARAWQRERTAGAPGGPAA